MSDVFVERDGELRPHVVSLAIDRKGIQLAEATDIDPAVTFAVQLVAALVQNFVKYGALVACTTIVRQSRSIADHVEVSDGPT